MKAVFLDYSTMGPDLDLSKLHALLPDLTIYDSTPAADIDERLAGAELVIANKVVFTEALLDANPQLRFVGLTATGVDNVNVEAAARHDVAVCNIRAYCTSSVAEHVFSVLLYLARNIRKYDDSMRRGEWQTAQDFCRLDFPIRELSAMTLGIIGYGELGRGVARLADAFGMRVLIAARPGDANPSSDRTSFEDVLSQSDVLSLHCPLNASTRKLFSTEEFARMKSDAILINTARGGLVDSTALVSALRDGHIGAAAIDVLPTEPPSEGDPLLDYVGTNLIVTPHIAWASREARQNAIDELCLNIEDFQRGGLRNRVN